MIKRSRCIVMRYNRTSVYCVVNDKGVWRNLNDLGNASIKSYMSVAKAQARWKGVTGLEFIPVIEEYTIEEDFDF